MTQHVFKTDNAGLHYDIIIGYFLPRKYYYMTITSASGKLMYSNIEEGGGLLKNLDKFIVKLSDLGFSVPIEMLMEIEEDAAAGIEKKLVHHKMVDTEHFRTPIYS